jgi:hypothetical protein
MYHRIQPSDKVALSAFGRKPLVKLGFRVIWLHPGDVSSYVEEELGRLPLNGAIFTRHHASAASMVMIIDRDGAICMPETVYLAACGQRSRSVK